MTVAEYRLLTFSRRGRPVTTWCMVATVTSLQQLGYVCYSLLSCTVVYWSVL